MPPPQGPRVVVTGAASGLDAGRLYAVPHRDGRWIWRLKRAVPELQK